jgi:hypothetical protein
VRNLCKKLSGFSALEVVATIGLMLLIYAFLGRVESVYREHVNRNRVVAELVGLVAALEKYKEIHGDYPRVSNNSDDDENSKTLNSALKGNMDPFGAVVPDDPADAHPGDRKKISLINTRIRELDARFIDQFGNGYLYYYATRNDVDNRVWTRHSFVLVSKGVDGIKTVVIGNDGTISQHKGDDIIADNTGIL